VSGWFGDNAECPVDAETKAWIDRRWKWLTYQFGANRVSSATVVLPLEEYFPDAFEKTYDSARVIHDRVCSYMGIAPKTVEMNLYQESNPLHNDKGPLGAAGLYEERDGKFHVWIEVQNLNDPLSLVATMAHELAHTYLLGQRRVSPDTVDHEPLTDLLTVFLGMGVMTANSVIREQSWQEGLVASWSMSRRGYLNMSEYGYALALFAEARRDDHSSWANHLRPDVRFASERALRFLATDPSSAAKIDQSTDGPIGTLPRFRPNVTDAETSFDDPVGEDDSIDAEELLQRTTVRLTLPKINRSPCLS
jgi:hypothetical protein